MKHHGNHISQAWTVTFGYSISHVPSPLRDEQKQVTIFEDLNFTF